MNTHDLIGRYIEIRDRKEEIAKEQKAVMARINSALSKIETILMEQLESAGSESIKTSAGTCYRSIRTSVKVEDREQFLDYIRSNEAWDLLESRAAKKDVEAFLEEHQDIPPGLSIRRDAIIGVRRPS
jgi:hypothetical protein